jgi:hypothetical protein
VKGLLDLAERCEAATGPDRDIDGWIAVAVDPDRQTIVGEKPGRFPRDPIYGPASEVMEKIGGRDGADYLCAPAYTASIDAAMSLVPEGWRFEVTTTGFKPGASIVSPKGTFTNGGGAYAATPALALCAAALRARASQDSKSGGES